MSEKPKKKFQLTMETIRMLDALPEEELRALITQRQPGTLSGENCAQLRKGGFWSVDSCPDSQAACDSINCS